MGFGEVAAFWAVSILLVCTPGADWAYAIAAGLRHRTVLPSVAGLLLGHLAATLVVATGVGALVSRQPLALAVLAVGGAVYLMWMGITTFLHPPVPTAGVSQAATSKAHQVARGFGVSGLNPKVFLLFLALLPQFTDADARWPIAVQILVLGIVHVASCAVVYTAVAIGAQRVLRTRPLAAKRVTWFSAAALILVGIMLLGEELVG